MPVSITVFLAQYLIFILFLSPLILWFSGQKKLSQGSLVSVFLAWVTGLVIKNFYYLPRPFITTGRIPPVPFLLDGSFPSNHALVAFSLAFFVIFRQLRLGLFLFILAVLVAVSRVSIGVHTWADVSGGLLLGLLISLLVHKYFRN
ncbi:hypothetical protein A3C34_00325 [Candidatus Amesbacteria bacterium RIFCSPHIGHO2_02_FULL_48_21]|uniref:Phosphatidic acid phosphatase type 2/haloperoxidase domain-containing protein n=2 Tax=Candidatus Amesiibacteriota TaxID=1752730 RepID=A0A1F5A057_9BACT|nr:MAG: phosphoesterase PA-phosphatase-like protein [Candidatus Amesbacteria bacterium GW2011_GWA1_48_9]OGC89842.1 MAG: hypothetical protein A2V48_04455 [Candidatus Amesbacteria bacterium RBG_19FT_COMBO_48_16]OGC96913.1 MAG: hypothetical protein A3C34_00325 [Candidatus Amesbacteria bacterium RIFCSPHIGHO2_02_FULL_48_21]OGD11945.1 MAG: hypothetical protein A2576_03220 [Candidatus Amesbacteria bacterium RIFOXYD1_FULL_47_9]